MPIPRFESPAAQPDAATIWGLPRFLEQTRMLAVTRNSVQENETRQIVLG